METKKNSTPADIAPLNVNMANKKRIHQYGLDGKYIQTYDSIAEAQKELGIKGVGIYRVTQGKAKSCHGFQWRSATD